MFVYRGPVLAVCLALMALAPAYGADKKAWCTDDHMKQMDADVAKMTDAKMQKSAKMHLDEFKGRHEEKRYGRLHQAHGRSPQSHGHVS